MPRKNILAIAQRQALKIHLDIALMATPKKNWGEVDNLLQTLTGYPEFYDDIDSKPTPVPAPVPPPPTPPPTALILSLLDKHSGGLTPHRICKETSLSTETAQQAISELIRKRLIYVPKKRGRKTFALIK